jgi:hypothetical protein
MVNGGNRLNGSMLGMLALFLLTSVVAVGGCAGRGERMLPVRERVQLPSNVPDSVMHGFHPTT